MTPVLRGATLMATAATLVAIDTIIIRIVSEQIHPFEISFFRSLFGLIVLAPWLARFGWDGLRSNRMPLHFTRAMLKLGALVCFYYAIELLPLGTVTAIAFTAPLFVALGSMALLGETAGRWRMTALVTGFAGVLIIVRPGTAVFNPEVLVALLAALGLGAVGLLMKFLSVREVPSAIVSLNLLMTVPVAFLVTIPVWSTPSPAIFGLLVVQGILGGVSQLAVSRAMALADASVLIPLDFLRLPLVIVLAWLAFDELTDFWTIAGSVVIFAATVALISKEHRLPPTDPGILS